MPQDVIQTISTSTIKVESTARITLTPSDLELLFLEYVQMGLLFPYPTPPQETALLSKTASSSLIHHLKTTLEQTLHFFPTLVARLATSASADSASTCFFLDCGHRDGGALFIHASARGSNLTMADVNESSSSSAGVLPSLFPLPGFCNIDGGSQPLLAVQATELADGLFLGWTVNHLVGDGTAFWRFLNSWAEVSRGVPISKLPILSRDKINLDLIGTRDVYVSNQLLAINQNNNNNSAAAAAAEATLSERVFRLSKESVTKLKARANKEMEESNGKISSLQAVIAHLWRSIIRCRAVAGDEATTFEIPMGARQRMSPPLPDEYFGNAVFPGIVTLDAGKVMEKGLGWTAWQVNRMVAAASGEEKVKEFFSSWAKEPKFLQFDDIPRNHFILINSPRFDVYGNDFGWGPPAAARSGKGSSFDGRITVSTGSEEGSLEVEVCLLRETLAAMAEDVEFMGFATLKI